MADRPYPELPSPDEIRLACGEISPSEMRTVLAVLGWYVRRAAPAPAGEVADRSGIFTLLSALDVTYEEAMSDELSRMQFWSKVQLARKAAIAGAEGAS